jgi:hypothetical protein
LDGIVAIHGGRSPGAEQGPPFRHRGRAARPALRVVEPLEEADRPAPVQLAFLHGPLFDAAGLVAA